MKNNENSTTESDAQLLEKALKRIDSLEKRVRQLELRNPTFGPLPMGPDYTVPPTWEPTCNPFTTTPQQSIKVPDRLQEAVSNVIKAHKVHYSSKPREC